MVSNYIAIVLRAIITSFILIFITTPFVFTGITVLVLLDDHVSYLPESYALGTLWVVEFTKHVMVPLSIIYIFGSFVWQFRPQETKTCLDSIKYKVNP